MAGRSGRRRTRGAFGLILATEIEVVEAGAMILPAQDYLALFHRLLSQVYVGIGEIVRPADNKLPGSDIVFAVARVAKPLDIHSLTETGAFCDIVVEL
jgi:hypothetical protein